MGAPTVSYKMLADGFAIDGDRQRGYRATAAFLVAWADAFTFADDIMGATSGSTLPPTWALPWKFPNSGGATMYAARFRIQPCGSDGAAEATNKGMIPGEFWSHAKIAVDFETPDFIQDAAVQDPSNVMQLDPGEPITLCEQSVRIGSKMVTKRKGGYEHDDGSAVAGDFAVPECETQIVLTFPRVPYFPWQQIRPYIGKVNETAIFDNPMGSLLLEGVDIREVTQSNGVVGTQAQLVFAVNDDGRDWNTVEKSDGVYALVRRVGDTTKRVYDYVEFRDLFA